MMGEKERRWGHSSFGVVGGEVGKMRKKGARSIFDKETHKV